MPAGAGDSEHVEESHAANERPPSGHSGDASSARNARPYRSYVGPAELYDVIGGLQFSILLHAGLREHHRLLDLGCGSLRGGRLFIPYLQADRYWGVEPRMQLVEDGLDHELGRDIVALKRPTFSALDDFSLESLGVEFDFVLAQSIFSHTFPDLARVAFEGVRRCLAPDGVLLATYIFEGELVEGSGWLYPGAVPYRWEDLSDLLESAGLEARPVSWPHPRQRWFAAGRAAGRVEEVAERLRGGDALRA